MVQINFISIWSVAINIRQTENLEKLTLKIFKKIINHFNRFKKYVKLTVSLKAQWMEIVIEEEF